MATYRVAVVNEDKRPVAGVVVEAVSLNSWPDVTSTATTGRNGTVQFTGISGPHWFRPRVRRTSTTVGGRAFTGAVEIQVVGSAGEKVCADYVVDCDGMGTHTTLAAAVADAITAQANRVIFICCNLTESDIEVGGMAQSQSITITAHNNRRVTITTNADQDMFKQTSAGGHGATGGLFFKHIGLGVLTADYAIFRCATGTEMKSLDFDRCHFTSSSGPLAKNYEDPLNEPAPGTSMGNLDIIVRNCTGTIRGFYQNAGSTPPNRLYALNNDLILRYWWKEQIADAEGDATNAADTSDVVGGKYVVTEWTTIALSGSSDAWSFRDFILFTGCSGAHFRHAATDTNHRGAHYSGIRFIATANDTDFGDFQGPTTNPQDNLYVVDIHGVAQSGVVPTGTFLIVDSDITDPYVNDIWAPAWPTVYSGPSIESGLGPARGALQRLQVWVADDAQNPSLGALPADAYVVSVGIEVTEAFDSDGTDQIRVGYDADEDAFATLTDVSTTGIKSPTIGTLAGFNGTTRAVEAYYVNGGSEPTTGKALITLEFFTVDAEPA